MVGLSHSPPLTMAERSLADATFFPGHSASIHVHLNGKGHVIGSFGILHPLVLEKYELKYPVTTMEFSIELFV
jgi:phenylalanyl-tRNA synthetase beta chain